MRSEPEILGQPHSPELSHWLQLVNELWTLLKHVLYYKSDGELLTKRLKDKFVAGNAAAREDWGKVQEEQRSPSS